MTAIGVDKIDVTGNAITISVLTATSLADAGIRFASDDIVTISDSGSNIALADVTKLVSVGVSVIDISDNAITLTAAKAAG